MSYRKIQAALTAHLQAFGAANLVFASSAHHPRHGSPYLVASFLPGKVKTVLLGPDAPKERRGFLQLNIHEVSNAAAMDQLDRLIIHFAHGLTLTFEGQTVQLATSEAGADRGTLTSTNIPLIIGWRSYF